jgi:hypothetical protein
MPIAAGNIIYASDLLMTSAQNADTTARTTTSTSYTTTLSPAQICGVAFVAPPSGKVTISWGCGVQNGTAPNLGVCSFAIREGSTVGSGTSFQASDDGRAVTSQAFIRAGASSEVTGLTAGDVYNVALEHRVANAGTGTFSNRSVLVTPELA